MAGRTVNKAELVDVIAQKANLTKVGAKAALEALLHAVAAALRRRDKVRITGFGTFEARFREGGIGKARNPQTGARVDTEDKWVPAFKAGQTLKDEVAGPRFV